jgi:hypothetical protein
MICLVSAAAAEGLPPPPVSAAPMMPQVNVVLKADGLGPLEALRQIVLSISSQCTDVVVVIPYHTIPYQNSMLGLKCYHCRAIFSDCWHLLWGISAEVILKWRAFPP